MVSSLWLLERGWEVAMTKELLIALGLPIAYLVLTTALLAGRHLRLTARDGLLWNTLMGIMIGMAALRY